MPDGARWFQGGIRGIGSTVVNSHRLFDRRRRKELQPWRPATRLFDGWDQAAVRGEIVLAILRGTAGSGAGQGASARPASQAGALSGIVFSRWPVDRVPGPAGG